MDGSNHRSKERSMMLGFPQGLQFSNKSEQETKQKRKQLEKVLCWGKKEIHDF